MLHVEFYLFSLNVRHEYYIPPNGSAGLCSSFAEDVRSFAVGFAQDLLALLKNLPKMAAENLKKTIDDIIDQIMDVYFFVSWNF